MYNWDVLQSQRPRSARALSNDRAIHKAGIEEILRVGVDHVSLRGVGALAGLTHGATYARYEDADELLVDLWATDLEQRAITLFTLCLNACESPSARTVGELFDHVRNVTPADIASVQVLLCARRIPVLLEEVEPFIVNYLQRENCASPVVSSTFTRAMCVYSLMIAQIQYSHNSSNRTSHLDRLQSWILPALLTNPVDVAAVHCTAPSVPLLDVEPFDIKSSVALATYQVVGKSGYTHATLSRIARRAKCSTGAIYGLYNSKEELVADTYRLANHRRWQRHDNFTGILDEGVVAQLLYETGCSINATWCNYLLEFSIATLFSPLLFEAISHETGGVALMIQALTGLDEEERSLLGDLVSIFSLLTYGVSFISAVCGSMECTNFSQFTEPLRSVVRDSVGTTWERLCEQIDLFAAQLEA